MRNLLKRYCLSLTYEPDSDIATANDSVNSNWTYTYDSFNRLGTSASTAQSYSYSYDRFGNRWKQTVTAGTGLNSSLSFMGGNNRIDSYSYDAAGNLLNDGVHSYTYDDENRVITVDGGATATYVYDALGNRVEKVTSSGTIDYVYDLAGREVTEITGGTWTRGEIYAGGKHVATYNLGTTYFDHADWLGTERARTTLAGAVAETCTSLPFGDGQTCTNSDASPMHFTGKERDAESGNDYFGARYYASSMGRFMSPDPMIMMPQKMTDPQQWNMYSYVRNNPLRMVDTNGEWPTDVHERIIDRAFPGLSAQQRQTLKSASYWMDHSATSQMKSNNHEHFMKSPRENPQTAAQAARDYISGQEHAAQTAQGGVPQNAAAINNNSLTDTGNAIHTATDGTSPAHVDANGNPRDWNGIPVTPGEVRAVQEHEAEEATPTDAQMNSAVSAAQRVFKDTYGDAAYQQAIKPPEPPKKNPQ